MDAEVGKPPSTAKVKEFLDAMALGWTACAAPALAIRKSQMASRVSQFAMPLIAHARAQANIGGDVAVEEDKPLSKIQSTTVETQYAEFYGTVPLPGQRAQKTYIGQLEALAYACVTESVAPEVFWGRQAYVFIDNTSTKFGLQKGYSRRPDTGRIINACKFRQAQLLFRPWFEYVPSRQNLADLPSRDRMGEYLATIFEATGATGSQWTDVVFPDFSSWMAPLETVPLPTPSNAGRRRKR